MVQRWRPIGASLGLLLILTAAGWPQIWGIEGQFPEPRYRDPAAAAEALRKLLAVSRNYDLQEGYADALVSVLAAEQGDYAGAVQVLLDLGETQAARVGGHCVPLIVDAATKRGDLVRLLSDAQLLTKERPDSVTAWRLLDLAASAVNEGEAMLAARAKLVELEPSDTNRLRLAEALRGAKRHEEAIRLVNEMTNPGAWVRLQIVGDCLVALDRKPEAEALADEIAGDPRLVKQDYGTLARFYGSLGLTDKQVGVLEKAITLNADDRRRQASIQLSLAELYEKAGRREEAYAALREATIGGDSSARSELAKKLADKTAEAVEFDAILDLVLEGSHWQYEQAIGAVASSATLEGKLAALVPAIDERVNRDPTRVALLELSLALHKEQKDSVAVTTVGRRLLDLTASRLLAYDLASRCAREGKHQEALDLLGEIGLDEWSLTEVALAARCWKELGQPEGLEALVGKLRLLTRSDAWRDAVEGYARLEAGQPDKAVPLLEEARNPAPLPDATRLEALARAYTQLGRAEDALQVYADRMAAGARGYEPPALALIRENRPPAEYVASLIAFCDQVLAAPRARPPEAPPTSEPRSAWVATPQPPLPPLGSCLDMWGQCVMWEDNGRRLPELVGALAKQAQDRPQDGLTSAALGLAELASGQYADAQRAFETASKLEPTGELRALLAPSMNEAARWTRPRTVEAATRELADIFARGFRDEELAKAVAIAASCLAAIPDGAEALDAARRIAGEANEAHMLPRFAEMAQAQARQSGDPALVALVLGCWSFMGPPDKFLEMADEFDARLDSVPALLEAVGIICGMQHGAELAQGYFDRILKADPNDWRHAIGFASVLARDGRTEEAKAWALQGFNWLQAGGEDPHAAARIGLSLAYQGCPDEAVQAVQKGLTLAPDDPEMHHFAGLTYEKLGKKAEAEAAWRAALDLKPDEALKANIDKALARLKGP